MKTSENKDASAEELKTKICPASLQFASDVKAHIEKLQSLFANKQASEYEVEHAFQEFLVMVNDFESAYRQIRSVSKHTMSNNGQPVLMCNVLQDQYEKVTVKEICKKYGIRCATTYYKHLTKMHESDWYLNLDFERLRDDAEYRSHVFANDLNEHRDLLPDGLKDASDYEIVCKEF